MEKDLNLRIKILEDVEEIKKLKSMYLYYIDDRDWDKVLDCFVEDAKTDYGPWGLYNGKKEIETFFKEIIAPTYSFHHHVTYNPLIDVEEDWAKGRWNLDEAATIKEGDRAIWISGRYDDEYLRENGRWKYKSIKITFFYVTPYEEGWGKTRIMDLK